MNTISLFAWHRDARRRFRYLLTLERKGFRSIDTPRDQKPTRLEKKIHVRLWWSFNRFISSCGLLTVASWKNCDYCKDGCPAGYVGPPKPDEEKRWWKLPAEARLNLANQFDSWHLAESLGFFLDSEFKVVHPLDLLGYSRDFEIESRSKPKSFKNRVKRQIKDELAKAIVAVKGDTFEGLKPETLCGLFLLFGQEDQIAVASHILRSRSADSEESGACLDIESAAPESAASGG